jgi:hypothetical protein
MPDFETYECENCGAEFKAQPGSNAAETERCSPACESAEV